MSSMISATDEVEKTSSCAFPGIEWEDGGGSSIEFQKAS